MFEKALKLKGEERKNSFPSRGRFKTKNLDNLIFHFRTEIDLQARNGIFSKLSQNTNSGTD